MKFSSKNFFSKCNQIPRKLRISSYLLKKFLMETFIFSARSDTLPTFGHYAIRVHFVAGNYRKNCVYATSILVDNHS